MDCKYYVCTFRIRVVTTAVTKRFRPRGQARVQDGVLTSYMDAAFVLLTPEGLEIWTNRSLLFTQVGLLQLQCDWSLCSHCFSRDHADCWRQTVRGSIASDTNVSFKQLCSRVVAITGPWICVVYRDIRLLKAHSRRVASPVIAWAIRLLVGVVLC